MFSDAQEGPKGSSGNNLPIPTTRVERVRLLFLERQGDNADQDRSMMGIAMAKFPELKLTT